jgi:hypothetical protein
MIRRRQSAGGVLLVVVGILLLLGNLGQLPIGRLPLLPVIVILTGLWLLADSWGRPRARGLTAGVVVVTMGAFWFAESMGWLDQQQFLAVLLLGLGLGLLSRSLLAGRV